jgi:hypothetical protein
MSRMLILILTAMVGLMACQSNSSTPSPTPTPKPLIDPSPTPPQNPPVSNPPISNPIDKPSDKVPVTQATQFIPALPPEVSNAIQLAQKSKTIYPITGNESFAGQILKADEIVFSSGAKLTLEALDQPWIAIVAKRLKFTDVSQYSSIIRDLALKAPDGQPGANGARGADGEGETNRQGNPGQNGVPGAPGGAGGTRQLPHLYLVIGELVVPDGQQFPGFVRLEFNVPGFDGGNAGRGGNGGPGGNGAAGKEGATSFFDCKSGGGPGGRGGDGGPGGAGGNGGNGGNGANVTLVSNPKDIELLSFAKILNIPGVVGRGNVAGISGAPGAGGPGAPRNGYCGPKDPGPYGTRPPPAGNGIDGVNGQKGTVTAFSIDSLAPLFP